VDEGCDDDKDDYCDKSMNTKGFPSRCPLGGGDCDDLAIYVNPAALELCDGLDNDCENGTTTGGIDEGCPVDRDGDGYCVASSTRQEPLLISSLEDGEPFVLQGRTSSLIQSVLWTSLQSASIWSEEPNGLISSTTCTKYEPAECDSDASRNPGKLEICNLDKKDENCNGEVNEDCERRIFLCGSIELNDDEMWPLVDENKSIDLNVPLNLSPSVLHVTYERDDCVGDEVRLIFKATFDMASDRSVTIDANAILYKGTNCDTEDYDASKDWDPRIIQAEGSSYYTDYIEDTGD